MIRGQEQAFLLLQQPIHMQGTAAGRAASQRTTLQVVPPSHEKPSQASPQVKAPWTEPRQSGENEHWVRI